MDFFQFADVEKAVWMLVVFGVVGLYVFFLIHHHQKLSRFVSATMQARLVTRTRSSVKVCRVVCMLLSGIAFVFALMRPQIVQEERVSVAKDAANVFVALDVSKSMLATDVVPNRLERAKSEVRDMLNSLTAHRLGLLAFAGRTTVLSPLTNDHGFFRLVLESASPESVTLGGTNLGEVIRKGTKLLSGQEGPKVLVLITDGEDHASYPEEAAEAARAAGIVIIAIGFGSETGTTIEYLDKRTGEKKRVMSDGRDVISRLDGALLRKIAENTQGIYVPAGSGVLDLEGIMSKHILPLVEETDQVHVEELRVDLFQWFVAVGIFFLVGAMLLSGRSRVRQSKEISA